MTYYEVKARLTQTQENGMEKRVNELYLFNAQSFTEAESRAFDKLRPYSEEIGIVAIKRCTYCEMFLSPKAEADKWYKCKVNFITLDEKSGVEKRTASYMMVQAADFKTALENLLKGMKGTMADYEIASITETLIMDIFRYDADSVPAAPGQE